MDEAKHFEVIIVGGSYAGLSAAMALGRSLRKVLIIDGGQPCNAQTPYSHNFITQDGVKPHVIAEKAKEQVLKYDTVEFIADMVESAEKINGKFRVETQNKLVFTSEKILFATGVKDLMPAIEGFSECWGISILHCPYCHGYEVKNEKIGLLAKGEAAFDLCKLIQHWTDDLTLFTNGPSELTDEQKTLIGKLNIEIVEKEIAAIENTDGKLENISFKDGSKFDLKAIFARVKFEQHCKVPIELGCNMTEHGHIDVNFFQQSSVEGVYAAGDNTTLLRSVSIVTAAGNIAGTAINMEMIKEALPE